jgi:Fe-S-cluster containining protein
MDRLYGLRAFDLGQALPPSAAVYGTCVGDSGDSMDGAEHKAAASVQVDFALAIGKGRLDASVVVPAGQVTLTQILPALQSLSSNIMANTTELVEAEGLKISCRAGCGACCRQLVPISLFEAEMLGDWIRSLPQEQQDELAERFHQALLALRDGGILDRLNPETWGLSSDAGDGAEKAAELALDYLKQRIACPFLVDESCSIHPIRPLICREYLVTSPPEFCIMPTRDNVVGVPVPVRLSTVMFKIGAEVEGGRCGWIPLVFLFAWMKSGVRPGDAIQGAGPEVLYEVVKRLAG